jgi:alpha-L-fucosidase
MRSRTRVFFALVLWACGISAPAQAPPQAKAATRTASFRQATFGLGIRWGLYSIPAGEWKGQMLAGHGEWIMREARIPVKEYAQLASQFNPAQFDAEAWVKFAEEAGAKYLVVTAKDRDGFAMYRSAASKYNVFDATPWHRDPLKELAAACAKRKMKLGISYSLAEDWQDPNGSGNNWDYPADNQKNLDLYLRDKSERQVRELLTGYGPLSVISFEAPLDDSRGQRFLDLAHALQPDAVVELGSKGDYSTLPRDRIPAAVSTGVWEAAQTVNSTGGFKKFDNSWKSLDQLNFNLVDVVSKGGNYLVEIGPAPDGMIPRPILVTLQSIGEWLKANQDAIYGGGPTPFGDEFNQAQPIRWRCTTKPGKIFITVFQWPNGAFELGNLKSQVTKAYLLADPSHSSLPVTQIGAKITVTFPHVPPAERNAPDRINPVHLQRAALAHVRSVLVLDTADK